MGSHIATQKTLHPKWVKFMFLFEKKLKLDLSDNSLWRVSNKIKIRIRIWIPRQQKFFCVFYNLSGTLRPIRTQRNLSLGVGNFNSNQLMIPKHGSFVKLKLSHIPHYMHVIQHQGSFLDCGSLDTMRNYVCLVAKNYMKISKENW